jgi:hypothetical protein
MLSVGNIAQAQGDASAVPELEAAHNRVQEATMAMKQAEDQNNIRAMERARNNYIKANQNMAQNLARVAGVRTEDVTGMQRAGMGWGQIAQELGLEPDRNWDWSLNISAIKGARQPLRTGSTCRTGRVTETETVTGIETSPSRIPSNRNAPGRERELEKDWAERPTRRKGSWSESARGREIENSAKPPRVI